MHQLIYRMNCDDVFTHIESEETKTYKKKKKQQMRGVMEWNTKREEEYLPLNPNHPQKKKWRWAIKHTRFCQH